MLGQLSNGGLRAALLRATTPDIIWLPQAMWPNILPEFGDTGWWYRVRDQIIFRECQECRGRKTRDAYTEQEWVRNKATRCKECEQSLRLPKQRKSESTTRKARRRRTAARSTPPYARSLRACATRVNYEERSTSDSDHDRDDRDFSTAQVGVLLTSADPRYVGRGSDVTRGDVCLTMDEVRQLLQPDQTQVGLGKVWLTTKQMGWSLWPEDDEIVSARDEWDGKITARSLAPAISTYVRWLWENARGAESTERGRLVREAWSLEQEWGATSLSEGQVVEGRSEDVEHHGIIHTLPSNDIRRHGTASVVYCERLWESPSVPTAADDPPLLPEVDVDTELGHNYFLDEDIPRHSSGQGYVVVAESSFLWRQSEESPVFTYQGLTTNTSINSPWTIMSGIWRHLRCKRQQQEADVASFIAKECARQEQLEAQKYRSPTWQVLKALKAIRSAKQFCGETAVTAPPFFEAACAGDQIFWGNEQGPVVVLWDSLDDAAKTACEKRFEQSEDWVVWSRERQPKDSAGVRPFERFGRQIFGGKAKLTSAPSPDKNSEHDASKGRAIRCKGWWKTGALDTCNNPHNMACWVHRNSPDVQQSSLDTLRAAWENAADKNECEATLEGPDRDFWLGSELGMLGGYAFKGVITGIDGSNGGGRMGAGCCCFQHPEADRWIRVGREDEGTSSNRPELGGLLLALEATPETDDLLVACDNEAVLKVIRKWIGQGGKATLVLEEGCPPLLLPWLARATPLRGAYTR